jgi:hypothetical protein
MRTEKGRSMRFSFRGYLLLAVAWGIIVALYGPMAPIALLAYLVGIVWSWSDFGPLLGSRRRGRRVIGSFAWPAVIAVVFVLSYSDKNGDIVGAIGRKDDDALDQDLGEDVDREDDREGYGPPAPLPGYVPPQDWAPQGYVPQGYVGPVPSATADHLPDEGGWFTPPPSRGRHAAGN